MHTESPWIMMLSLPSYTALHLIHNILRTPLKETSRSKLQHTFAKHTTFRLSSLCIAGIQSFPTLDNLQKGALLQK